MINNMLHKTQQYMFSAYLPNNPYISFHIETAIIMVTTDDAPPSTLVMEAVEFSYTSVNYRAIWRQIPQSGLPISRPSLEHDLTQIQSKCVTRTTATFRLFNTKRKA